MSSPSVTASLSDLEFAHLLADAADAVSTKHFRSEELRTTHKGDGTPVSQVDFDVEQTMLQLVRTHRPNDHVLGEEVGEQPAKTSSTRRWIFDGIDGTHNYAAGWPGWGTLISLMDGDNVILGMVSSPMLHKRWWAELGKGAWAAINGDRVHATQVQCGNVRALENASVIVTPPEGQLHGWRNNIAKRFPPPAAPRSMCLGLDAVMVASGELDVALLILGSIWDYAGSSLIVREAGGVFHDAWGGHRFDTSTAVITNPNLLDGILTVVADIRPEVPDEARLARTVLTPIKGISDEAVAQDEWLGFGLRSLPSMSAREHVTNAPPMIMEIVAERSAHLVEPLRGVTTDGMVRAPTRFDAPTADTRPIINAAATYLRSLTDEQRATTSFAMDAIEWRMWINVHMNHFRHGLLLERCSQEVRDNALAIVAATLSARGYTHARSIMKLNELLAEVTGDYEAFGEWPYFMSIFGTPGTDAPWGWQIDGHHLALNCVVFDGRIVMTPAFMGSEPRRVNHGPYAGTSLFDPEEELGLELIRSLDIAQRERAILYPSIHPDDISTLLQNLFDGRMQGGAFHDNLVAPYQGIPGGDMTTSQREIFRGLINTYVDWSAEQFAHVRKREVEAHLDESWFSWYGGYDDVQPFYYRVHSPAILIEFDHHPGIAFANENPTRHHVHMVVRTPNGGDYGADLLAQHHARFHHANGTHTSRG